MPDNPTPGDVITRIAVAESELRRARTDIVEVKVEQRDFQFRTEAKLDHVISQIQNLQGQRTVISGIVSAIVSAGVAFGAAWLRK